MLTPEIFVYNATILDISLPDMKEAVLKKVDSPSDLPDAAIVLFITEDLGDLTSYRDMDRQTYFVYIGDGEVDFHDGTPVREDILALFRQRPRTEDLNLYITLWARAIAGDYGANLYRRLLQTLIDSSPDMIWFKDEEERHVILNRAFCDVVGKDYSFCIGKKHPDIWDISWEEYESSDFACRQSENEIMQTGRTGRFDEPVMTHGEVHHFSTYKTPIYDRFENVLGTCGIGRDMTNIENMGNELDILLTALPYPAFICDREFNIQRSNNAARQLTQSDQITNYKVWKEFFLRKEGAESMINDGSVYTLRQGVNSYHYSVAEREIKDLFGNVIGYICIFRDVSYQRLYDELMFKAANVDTLTGAYNRRYFYEKMEKSVGRAVTLLYMDLDNFKKVNDVFGHDKGDEILTGTVTLIKNQFPDGLLVRLGGDEFAVLIYGVKTMEELEPAIRVMNNEIPKLADSRLGLGVSIGYGSTEKLENVEEFVKSCDDRMYEQKHVKHAG